MSARIEAWAVTVMGDDHFRLFRSKSDAEKQLRYNQEGGCDICGLVHLIPATDLARALDVLRELVDNADLFRVLVGWAASDRDSSAELDASLLAARALLAEVDR